MELFVGIIPARFASTRFPGKPLAYIGNKTMIQRVYERASKVLDNVAVATDDDRIFSAVKSFGGNVVMTSSSHRSGTDRCNEALDKFEQQTGKNFTVVINIQGDEPFVRTDQIELIMKCFMDQETQIATLIKPITENTVIFDPNRPKVVINKKGFALYFSRSAIPFIRDMRQEIWSENHQFFQHIGMYAYQKDILKEISVLEQSVLEQAESLEQLRWLENGYKIKTAITEFDTYGIDTKEDLNRAIELGFIEE